MNIKFLTGIPRSGTTLCCRILNECNHTVALHEPISPNKLASSDKGQAISEILLQARAMYLSVISGQEVDHGDSTLLIDNPVAESKDSGSLRQVKAKRGKIKFDRQPENTTLIIKQNALFTSLLPELADNISVTGIIRNPVPVLLSWMTVNLPVNKGRIPAAERFDTQLNEALNSQVLEARYASVYNWFIAKFIQARIHIIKYEDIIATQGSVLTRHLANQTLNYPVMGTVSRSYDESHLSMLKRILPSLKTQGLYSTDDVEAAFNRVTITD